MTASRKGALRLIRPLVYVTEDLTAEYVEACGLVPVGCVCGEKDNVRREICQFLGGMRARYSGVPRSITAALGNVNPYTLFDRSLRNPGADSAPALAASSHPACS